MTRIELNRREFLKGCCATAAVGAAGPALFFSGDANAAVNPYDTVVLIFLRGGMDGLNLVVPTSGNDRVHYEQARPSLNIAATGTFGALPLTLGDGAATPFGLHPSATGLRDIWTEGKLAIVHSCACRHGHAQPLRCAAVSRSRYARATRRRHRLADPRVGHASRRQQRDHNAVARGQQP